MQTMEPTKVVTAAEMQSLEAQAVQAGATWRGLMLQAGQGIAAIALRLLGAERRPVVVLVGPGNNGGDSLVVAAALHDAGLPVTLYEWRRAPTVDDWPWQAAQARSLPMVLATADLDQVKLRRLVDAAGLIVDGLLGSGVHRPLPADLQSMIAVINTARRCPLLAIDLPTGIDADTGAVQGSALRADITAATGLLKRGHLAGAGRMAAGELLVVSLGLTQGLEQIMSEKLTAGQVRNLLPVRPTDSNKGTFGKVLIVAGSARYPGAAFLTTSGALRSGAGLVTLALGRSIYGALAASIHESTFLPLPEADWGTLGPDAAIEIRENLEGYTALVVGPGLGREEDTQKFLARLLKLETTKTASSVGFVKGPVAKHERASGSSVGFMRLPTPSEKPSTAKPKVDAEAAVLPTLVLDADALNLLADIEDWHTHLAPQTAVLTPHPGELARLLKLEDAAAVQADRIGHAQRAAEKWGQIVVLKGANTIIASPEGPTLIGPDGNPALATAGTGDVLAGVIGGLIAQGVAPFAAAQAGVWLHAAAGQRVRDELGDAGTLAGDLLGRLPLALRELRAG